MSKITQALIQCPHCRAASDHNVHISVNVTVSPELKEKILAGSLFWKECPNCGRGFNANHDLLYHDMENQFCVWLKYENQAGEIELECGADRADRIFKDYRLRIAFVRDELIEKIKLTQDGYDDIFIETLKLFHSIKSQIDLAAPFYYDRTEENKTRKTLVFILGPKGSEPREHRLDLSDASAVEPFIPQISAALQSEWAPWMWVTRAAVLQTFEDCA